MAARRHTRRRPSPTHTTPPATTALNPTAPCAALCVLQMIKAIKAAVTIPVMAKARIGHFVEAQILEAVGVDYIDESEVGGLGGAVGGGRP